MVKTVPLSGTAFPGSLSVPLLFAERLHSFPAIWLPLLPFTHFLFQLWLIRPTTMKSDMLWVMSKQEAIGCVHVTSQPAKCVLCNNEWSQRLDIYSNHKNADYKNWFMTNDRTDGCLCRLM